MTDERHQVYCPGCGSLASAGDRYCGTCGAGIPSDAQAATPTEEIPILVQPPPVASSARGPGRRLPRWLVPVVLLIVMVVSTGALAYAALGPEGGSTTSQKPPTEAEGTPPQENQPQDPTPSSAGGQTPSTRPNSDEQRLEEFVRGYDDANRRGDWEGTYSMLDETSRQEFTEAEWSEKQRSLREAEGPPAPLGSVDVRFQEGVSDAPATVILNYEDGTQETMVAGVPMAVTSEEEAGEPKRTLTEEEISYLEGLGEDEDDLVAEVEEAAGDYYRAAGVGDWDYTYDALDSETQSGFTREEWSQKNQWFLNNGPTLYNIETVSLDESSSEPLAEVAVRLTGEDGSSATRITYFIYEDGTWKHRFSEEEINLFMPGIPYGEFVETKEG